MVELPPFRPALEKNCGYPAKASGLPCVRKAVLDGHCRMHYLVQVKARLKALKLELSQRREELLVLVDKTFPTPLLRRPLTPAETDALAEAADELRRADARLWDFIQHGNL